MRITVKVQTKAKGGRVERVGEGSFKVWVKATPEAGKANQALIKALAGYFKIPAGQVKIISGLSSRDKIVEVS